MVHDAQPVKKVPSTGFLWPRAAAFSVGLFTVCGQTALLREYLVLFRGSELALGLFFACWFLWVAVAATVARRWQALRAGASRHAATLMALHPLGAFLGVGALVGVRHLAGIPPYDPTPPGALFLGACLATAPVSVITGLLFPALCDLSAVSERSGASVGYVAESAGAFGGGLAATGAFLMGMDGLTVVAAMGLPSIGLALVRTRWLPVPAAMAVILVLVPPTGSALQDWIGRVRLDSSLLDGEFLEDIHTPYQLLTMARLPDQEVLLSNGAVEAVFPPGPEVEARAALLASQPSRRGEAVVLGGGGYPVALALSRYFARVRVVVTDPAVGDALEALHGRVGDSRAPPTLVRSDPRAFVRRGGGQWDLVVIAGPEPGNLQANRLYTVEFFRELAPRLAPGGVVTASVRSAENHVGTEFLRYGQSVWQTLDAVFPETAVIPGDSALFLAGPTTGRFETDPVRLSERYRAFAPRPFPFPPQGFYSLVQADKSESTLALYGSADAPADLTNRDSRPLASFLYLLTLLRQSDSPGARTLWSIHGAGMALPAGLLVVLLIVLLRHRLRHGPRGEGFAAGILMATVGGASISASVTLLAAFQSVVGALYGEVGAATGVFMAGLGLGAAASSKAWQGLDERRSRFMALGFCVVVSLVLAGVPPVLEAARILSPLAATVSYGGLFLGCGLLFGAAWPLAAAVAGPGGVASRLEAADHWGATVGAAVTGLFVVAVFGQGAAFGLLSGMFLVAGAALAFDALLDGPAGARFFDTRLGGMLSFRSLPYGAAAAAVAMAVLASLVVHHATRGPEPGMQTRLDARDLQRHETFSSETFASDPFPHHRLAGVSDSGAEAVAAATRAVAPDVAGYGGPMNFLLSVGTDGIIRRVAVLAHRETPSYVTGLPDFLGAFEGRDVHVALGKAAEDAVDAMTGATVTRDAALRSLDRARESMATGLLGLTVEGAPSPSPWYARLAVPETAYAVGAVAGAVAVHFLAAPLWRLLFLVVSLVVGGLVFNIQLSATWLLSLARWELPSFSANAPLFLLTLGVLSVSVLFGPLYCAHVCPFGALQELVGRLSKRLGVLSPPPGALSDRARGLKYLVLAGVVGSLFTRDPSAALAWDPLGTFYLGHFPGPAWAVIGLALAGSFLFFRFWCRVFCPVGAFFLLFNRLAGLLGLGPARRYPRCDLGVKGPADIECLQCNRCLREPGTTDSSQGVTRPYSP